MGLGASFLNPKPLNPKPLGSRVQGVHLGLRVQGLGSWVLYGNIQDVCGGYMGVYRVF